MPLAFNTCGNGYQNHCDKLEAADSETSSTALARPADPAWFHRLSTRRFYEKPTVCTIGLGLLLATASAYAQTGVVKANVPFNFIVEKTQIPAGQYLIQNLGITGSAMMIESPDRKLVKVVLPNACESVQAQEATKLVFHRYRDQYFLAQIWTAGNDRGRELRKTQRETELAMAYPAHDVVVVATLR